MVAEATYRNPEVLCFVEHHAERLGTRDPEAIVRHLCRQIVARATSSAVARWEGPPFNVEILASLIGCTVRPDFTGSVEDARFLPDMSRPGRGTIMYNPSLPPTRRAFSIAHELGHSLFHQAGAVRGVSGDDEVAQELETLCDIAAGELLMPSPHFDLDLREHRVSMQALLELQERYGASLEATAYRIQACSDIRFAVAVLEHRLKPREIHQMTDDLDAWPAPKLRFNKFRPGHGGHHVYIPRHKSIADDCPLYDAFQERSWPFKGELAVELRKKRHVFYAEVTPMPWRSGSHVIAFLFDPTTRP